MKSFKILLSFFITILFLNSCSTFSEPVTPPNECFATEGNTIIKYDLQNNKCPTNIIIPNIINGVIIENISKKIIFDNIEDELSRAMQKNPQSKEMFIKYCKSGEYNKECEKLIKEIKQNIKIRKLTGVLFSDSIKIIENGAFILQDIEEIKLGRNIKRIGDAAFFGNNIQKVDLSEMNENIIIDERAFGMNDVEKIISPSWKEDFTLEDLNNGNFKAFHKKATRDSIYANGESLKP